MLGKASPATFISRDHRGVRALVHGDDFAVLADEGGLMFLEQALTERCEYKCTGKLRRGLGSGRGCAQHVKGGD